MDMDEDWSDFAEEDFDEVDSASAIKVPLTPVMLSAVHLGKHRTARLQFSIDPDIIAQIGANRVRVEWNKIKGVYRLKSSNEGKYQVNTFARSTRCWVRVVFPDADLYEIGGRHSALFQVNSVDKSLLVRVPPVFFTEPENPKQKILAPLPPTPPRQLFSPTPLKPRAPEAALDDPKIVRAALGLSADAAPTLINGEKFTPAEAEVVRLFSQRILVTREMVLLATRDPANPDEDDRDEKLLDVYVCRVKPKLKKMSIFIKAVYGQGFTISQDERTLLKRYISEAKLAA